MRILIADDDEGFLELLQSYLWDRGHEAEFAVNGLECCTVLQDFVPEVMVLQRDLLWGGGDGVLAYMRDDPRMSAIPVILIADTQAEFESLAQPPVIAWMQKPFRLGDLIGQLETVRRLASPANLCATFPEICEPTALAAG